MHLDLTLDVAPDAPRRVRHALAPLASSVPARVAETVYLVVTELINEAIARAAEGSVRIRVSTSAQRLRIEIRDGRKHLPRWKSELESSLGKRVLDAVASRWGIIADGERIGWAEIDLDA